MALLAILKAGWTLVFGFLKGLSPQAWRVIGIVVGLLLVVWYIEHWGYNRAVEKIGEQVKTLEAKVKTVETERDDALGANKTNQSTIAALQGSVAQCEAGRIADQTLQAKAMAERNKATVAAQAQFAKAKADLDALTKGRCSNSVKLPVCGATQ
jgi:hypothetical protein